MQRTLARIVAGLALGAVVLSSGRALADERTEARAHYKKGMAEIADGHYDQGIAELRKAYDILPHPTVLYNLARAYQDSGDIQNAVVYYKKYLEGDPRDRDEVAQIVAALDARIRRQQAELLEAQQAHPTPGAPPAPGAPSAPGAPPTAAPAHGAAAGAVAAGKAPPVPAGEGLKTEEVFEETVVTASKAAQSPLDAPNSTSIITEQDIRLSGIVKIPELLRRLAGVDIMETTGSQTEVSLRGFNQRLSNKVLVLVNGRSVYVDLLGATLWQTLSIGVEDIERIEVVRGPGSALYGADAFNGVINIITKTPGDGGSGFNVGYGDENRAHGTIWASGRDKEIAYRISAGFDNIPRWSSDVAPNRADLVLGANDQQTSERTERIDATITRRFGEDVTVGVQGGYTTGSSELLGVGPINDILINPFYASDASVFLHSKHIEARAFINRLEGDNQLNAAPVGQSLLPARFNLNVVDGEVQYVDQFETGKGVGHDLHIGLNYRLKWVDWTYQSGQVAENHGGFFVHDEVKFLKRFAIVGDYRADYDPYLDAIIQSPRASVLFHPTKASTIRAIVGTAVRTPDFLEEYVGFPIQLPVTGGAQLAAGARPDQPGFKLKPEQVLTTEVGYLNSDSDYFTFDSAFFYNHVHDLIDISPTRPITVGDLNNSNVPTAPDPQTGLYPLFLGGFENECQQFNVYGAELGLRTFPVEGLDIYGNTTLMDVQQDNSACTAAQVSLLSNDARTSAVKVNAGAQIRTKIGWDGSLDFHYVSPQDWAEQVESVQRQQIVYQTFHLDAYTLFSASLGYRFLHNQADARIVVDNLTDDRHREHPFGQILDRRAMGYLSYRF